MVIRRHGFPAGPVLGRQPGPSSPGRQIFPATRPDCLFRLAHAHARIQRRQLRLRTWLRPAPLQGDPDLIERLVANLIDNAVQHNIPGGAIDVTSRLEDGQVILSVANTGPVIPPADIDRLFQPFQRAAGRTDTGTGHGLGLSIVAAIATAHGAALTTRAQPQGGLHIQVSFPATGRPQLQPHDLTTVETASTAC